MCGIGCDRSREVDEVQILPRGSKVRVRDVQVHGAGVDRAWAGQRVALNLGGVAKDGVARGDTVAAPQSGLITERFDAKVEIRPLASRPLRSHERVRVYLATREVMGRIVWLDGVAEVGPRQASYAQVVLSEPAVAGPSDRFVIRDETSQRTLGGGVVLVARTRKHRKSAGAVSERLRLLETGDLFERVCAFLQLSPQLGLPADEIAAGIGVDADAIRELAEQRDGAVILPDASGTAPVMLEDRYDAYVNALLARVEDYHRSHREQAGIDLELLRAGLQPEVDGRLFRNVIEALVESSHLCRRGSSVFMPGHEVSMNSQDEAVARRLLEVISAAGSTPPSLKQLEEELGLDPRRLALLVQVLVERGSIVKVSADLFFDAGVLAAVEATLRTFLQEQGEISAAKFRDLITASRKYCIPLLDHFDRSGVTIRVGDFRKLRV